MSLATTLGFALGLILFFGSIIESTTNFGIFLHAAGFVMVVGGTLSATFVAYEPRYVMLALKNIKSIFFSPKINRQVLQNEVARVIRWAYMMQKSGLPALEADAGKIKQQDRFLGFAVELVISGYTGEEVREMLSTTINTSFQRHTVAAEILKSMASNAPAFGMIATLVGLVIMLDNMGSDPSQLGPGMAVGLLGTLYGVLFARLILMPVASKIQQREEIIRFRNYLVAEGMSLLAERRAPRFIQDKMNSFLDPAIHFNIDKMKK